MLIVEIGMEMDELHQELLDLLIQGNYNNFISFFVANQALISTEHVFEVRKEPSALRLWSTELRNLLGWKQFIFACMLRSSDRNSKVFSGEWSRY